MSSITKADIPEYLQDLVQTDADLARVQRIVSRIQDLHTKSRRTIQPLDALKLFKLIPRTSKPTLISELGYGYNAQEQLRSVDGGEKFYYINEALYQALGDLIVPHIQNLMLTDKRYNLVALPVPEDATANDPQTQIFATPDWATNDKLVLLIHGAGAVRGGQWARALCINESLNEGSVLPYVTECIQRGWAVMVLNPNDNIVTIPNQSEPEPLTGLDALEYWTNFDLKQLPKSTLKKAKVRGSSEPEQHVEYVYDHYVGKAKCSQFAIVAHSYGGVSTLNLLETRISTVFNRLRCVAFTDAVHDVRRAPMNVQKFISDRSINWISSTEPRDTPAPQFDAQPRVSSGHAKHEWTSWSAMPSVFPFIEKHWH